MTKQKILIVCANITIIILSFYSLTFAEMNIVQNLLMTSTISEVSELSLATPTTSFSLGFVSPNGTWNNSEGVTANYWNIANPIKFTLTIKNNKPTTYLYIYTDHQNQNYWSQSITNRLIFTSPTPNLNGLINTDQISSQNSTFASASIRAWADYYQEGSVTTNPTANWTWICDKKGPPLFTETEPRQVLLDKGYINFMNKSVDVYIRSAWPTPKIAGTYKAKIFIEMSSQ